MGPLGFTPGKKWFSRHDTRSNNNRERRFSRFNGVFRRRRCESGQLLSINKLQRRLAIPPPADTKARVGD